MPFNPDLDPEIQIIEVIGRLADAAERIEGRIASLERVFRAGVTPPAVPTAKAAEATQKREAQPHKDEKIIEGCVTELVERSEWVKATVDSGKWKVFGLASKRDDIKAALINAYKTGEVVKVAYTEKPSPRDPKYIDRYANRVESTGTPGTRRPVTDADDDII